MAVNPTSRPCKGSAVIGLVASKKVDCTQSLDHSQKVAKVIWNTFQYSFAELQVKVGNSITYAYTFGGLESMFGKRPTQIPNNPLSNSRLNSVTIFLIALLGFAVLLFIFTISFSRKRRSVPRDSSMDLFASLNNSQIVDDSEE